MSGKPGRSGRPRQQVVDPSTLDLLTIPQVLAYLRQLHRPLGRAKLDREIATGRLPVLVDRLHFDRLGNARVLVQRAAVDRWLAATLTPLQIRSLAS